MTLSDTLIVRIEFVVFGSVLILFTESKLPVISILLFSKSIFFSCKAVNSHISYQLMSAQEPYQRTFGDILDD